MSSKIILIVEDNADDERLTLRVLKKEGIPNEVVVVRDGAEALDYLFATGAHQGRSHDRMPQLVLLDMKLPKIDGLGVLQRLRADERTRLLPVVVFTSSREEKGLVESYKLGANSYVCKPVDFDQFAAAVRQVAMYWLGLNESAPPTKT